MKNTKVNHNLAADTWPLEYFLRDYALQFIKMAKEMNKYVTKMESRWRQGNASNFWSSMNIFIKIQHFPRLGNYWDI